MRCRHHKRDIAFSLVEVVLAMGVISFAIVGMFGLISVGFSAAKKAAVDTNLSLINSQALAALRSDTNMTSAKLGVQASTPTNIYFDAAGKMQAAQDASSLYQCQIASRAIPNGTFSPDVKQFTVLVMTVSFPVAAADARRTKEVLHATLAK